MSNACLRTSTRRDLPPVAGPLVGHARSARSTTGWATPIPGLEVRIVHEVSSGDEAALEWEADLIDPDGKRFPICGVNFVQGARRKVHARARLLRPDLVPAAGTGLAMDLSATVRVGTTELQVPRIGIGTASLGNMLAPVSDEVADAALSARPCAADSGTSTQHRCMATASPSSESGARSQRSIAPMRSSRPRSVACCAPTHRATRASTTMANRSTRTFPPDGPIWDFSYERDHDLRCRRASQRLDLGRVDMLLLHDPDNHYEQASDDRVSGTRRAALARAS